MIDAMKSYPFLVLALAGGLMHAAIASEPSKPVTLLKASDLSAWEFVTKPDADIATVCHANPDGSFAIIGKPVGYLATKASFTSYRLHAEWRWPADAAKNSNGGVLLNMSSGPSNGTAWPVCIQMQLKLTRAGDMLPMNDAKFTEKLSTAPDAKTPQLDRSGAECEKPLGQWNSCDITSRNGTIEVIVNGITENKVTGCTPAAGKVGFQLEGTPFELRNVRIEPLK
jgi:hypothetical protein